MNPAPIVVERSVLSERSNDSHSRPIKGRDPCAVGELMEKPAIAGKKF